MKSVRDNVFDQVEHATGKQIYLQKGTNIFNRAAREIYWEVKTTIPRNIIKYQIMMELKR